MRRSRNIRRSAAIHEAELRRLVRSELRSCVLNEGMFDDIGEKVKKVSSDVINKFKEIGSSISDKVREALQKYIDVLREKAKQFLEGLSKITQIDGFKTVESLFAGVKEEMGGEAKMFTADPEIKSLISKSYVPAIKGAEKLSSAFDSLGQMPSVASEWSSRKISNLQQRLSETRLIKLINAKINLLEMRADQVYERMLISTHRVLNEIVDPVSIGVTIFGVYKTIKSNLSLAIAICAAIEWITNFIVNKVYSEEMEKEKDERDREDKEENWSMTRKVLTGIAEGTGLVKNYITDLDKKFDGYTIKNPALLYGVYKVLNAGEKDPKVKVMSYEEFKASDDIEKYEKSASLLIAIPMLVSSISSLKEAIYKAYESFPNLLASGVGFVATASAATDIGMSVAALKKVKGKFDKFKKARIEFETGKDYEPEPGFFEKLIEDFTDENIPQIKKNDEAYKKLKQLFMGDLELYTKQKIDLKAGKKNKWRTPRPDDAALGI